MICKGCAGIVIKKRAELYLEALYEISTAGKENVKTLFENTEKSKC